MDREFRQSYKPNAQKSGTYVFAPLLLLGGIGLVFVAYKFAWWASGGLFVVFDWLSR